MAKEGREEHFVLRVLDPQLADRLRGGLREELQLSDILQLDFKENGREGTLTVEGQAYPVHVLDLPTMVESYKTYDDVNLVKTGDVPQVLLVGKPSAAQQAEIDRAKAGGYEQSAPESLDGVTVPMRSARQRHLRPRYDVPPNVVTQVEDAILDILEGNAPVQTEFLDVEEEFVVDNVTGRGRWKQVPRDPSRDSKPTTKSRGGGLLTGDAQAGEDGDGGGGRAAASTARNRASRAAQGRGGVGPAGADQSAVMEL